MTEIMMAAVRLSHIRFGNVRPGFRCTSCTSKCWRLQQLVPARRSVLLSKKLPHYPGDQQCNILIFCKSDTCYMCYKINTGVLIRP